MVPKHNTASPPSGLGFRSCIKALSGLYEPTRSYHLLKVGVVAEAGSPLSPKVNGMQLDGFGGVASGNVPVGVGCD
jgi:hypothetical protein